MSIIYTCPSCNSDLSYSILTVNPPIHRFECSNCGWKNDERETIKRVPLISKDTEDLFNSATIKNINLLDSSQSDLVSNLSVPNFYKK